MPQLRHAGLQQAVHQALGEHRDDARVAVEGAVADHAAAAVVEVEHRREAEVDAAGAQLGAEHVAGGGGGLGARIAPRRRRRRRRPSTSRRARASAADA